MGFGIVVAVIVNCRVASSTDNESDRCRKLAKSHMSDHELTTRPTLLGLIAAQIT